MQGCWHGDNTALTEQRYTRREFEEAAAALPFPFFPKGRGEPIATQVQAPFVGTRAPKAFKADSHETLANCSRMVLLPRSKENSTAAGMSSSWKCNRCSPGNGIATQISRDRNQFFLLNA